jgi:hypothetical protein
MTFSFSPRLAGAFSYHITYFVIDSTYRVAYYAGGCNQLFCGAYGMKKTKTTVERRTISVPALLDQRMAKVDDVNWSAVACEAFERKLGEIAAQKKEKNMDDVIARLRATNDDNQDELYLKGKEDGETWAKEDATAAQLRRLDRLHASLINESRFDWNSFFTTSEPGVSRSVSVVDSLGCNILGVDPLRDRDRADEFWESAVGEYLGNRDLEDDSYLKGFAEGALQVWWEVAAKI